VNSLLAGLLLDFDHGSGFALCSFRVLFLLLRVLYKRSKDSDLFFLVLLEVEIVLFAEAHLKQIVVEALLGNTDLAGCVFERIAHQVSVANDSVVQLAPETDFLDDLFDCALLGTLLTRLRLGLHLIVE